MKYVLPVAALVTAVFMTGRVRYGQARQLRRVGRRIHNRTDKHGGGS